MTQRIRLVARLACVGWLVVQTAQAESLTVEVGDNPPKLDFEILKPQPEDEGLSWESLKGQAVVLDFWATWCQPCIHAFPHLNELVETFADEPVRFFSLTYETRKKVEPFLAEHRLETTVALDNDFAMFSAFKAWGIPYIVLVSPEGVVATVIHPNYLTEEVIREVLAGKVPDVQQHEGWSDPAGAEEYFRSLRDS